MKSFKQKLTPLFVLIFFTSYVHSQECAVEKESLKGTYTGDCKKGKAQGKGKAVGIDTYEGDFKSGLPDGHGTYTWGNKNVFTGKFIKGLREGFGTMNMKNKDGQDSVFTGFWKKDEYIGKNENPWLVNSKSGSVSRINVDYTKGNANTVKIVITSTTGGVPSLGGTIVRPIVSNVTVLKGSFERTTSLESHYKSTETSFTTVVFPFRIKFNIGTEAVDMDFFEQGSYSVEIYVNN